MYFSNQTPFETFSSDVRNVSNPYILDGCNLGKRVARGSSVRTAGRPAGPPNAPASPPNGPDGGAGDRRLRPWYLTRGWIMSHTYICKLAPAPDYCVIVGGRCVPQDLPLLNSFESFLL